MKHGRMIGLCVTSGVIGVLAVGTADAGSVDMSGAFKGDADSSISFKVGFSKSGVPKRVSHVRYTNVDMTCNDGSTVSISGQTDGGKIKEDKGKLIFLAGGPGDPEVNINAYVNNAGTRSHGVGFFAQPDGSCSVGGGPGPALTFTAAK